MSEGVFRGGKVHVRAAECDKCLFSPDRLVSGKRAREIVASTRGTDGAHFVCHRDQTEGEPTTVCRGWFDRFADEDPVFRLASIMGVLTDG